MTEAMYDLMFTIEFLANVSFKIIILILLTMYLRRIK